MESLALPTKINHPYTFGVRMDETKQRTAFGRTGATLTRSSSEDACARTETTMLLVALAPPRDVSQEGNRVSSDSYRIGTSGTAGFAALLRDRAAEADRQTSSRKALISSGYRPSMHGTRLAHPSWLRRPNSSGMAPS